jgi:quercetin dioxygenase-like cupin family protein
MSSIQRSLSGDVLVFDLKEERDRVAGSSASEQRVHTARTLLKNGPLRVTLVALAPGGVIPDHQAEGPITVQVLEGNIRFTAGGRVHDVGPGQLLSAGPGLRHAVASAGGAAFLLTVVKADAATEQKPVG